VVYLVLEFMEENQTLAKVKGDNVHFFLANTPYGEPKEDGPA
jgi:hypothetical protein